MAQYPFAQQAANSRNAALVMCSVDLLGAAADCGERFALDGEVPHLLLPLPHGVSADSAARARDGFQKRVRHRNRGACLSERRASSRLQRGSSEEHFGLTKIIRPFAGAARRGSVVMWAETGTDGKVTKDVGAPNRPVFKNVQVYII